MVTCTTHDWQRVLVFNRVKEGAPLRAYPTSLCACRVCGLTKHQKLTIAEENKYYKHLLPSFDG